MKRTITHFEIPANDVEKLRAFYAGVLGWKIEKAEGMDYWMIDTGSDGEGPNGGMMPKTQPTQAPLNYYDVESVDDFSQKVVSLGGRVIMPKMAVPTMGWFAVCTDPEGNAFGLWQTDPNAA